MLLQLVLRTSLLLLIIMLLLLIRGCRMLSLIRLLCKVTCGRNIPSMKRDVARSAPLITSTPVAASTAALGSVVRITNCLEVVRKLSFTLLLVVISRSLCVSLLLGRIFRALSNVVTWLRASVADVIWVESSGPGRVHSVALVLPELVPLVKGLSFGGPKSSPEVPSCASGTPGTS